MFAEAPKCARAARGSRAHNFPELMIRSRFMINFQAAYIGGHTRRPEFKDKKSVLCNFSDTPWSDCPAYIIEQVTRTPMTWAKRITWTPPHQSVMIELNQKIEHYRKINCHTTRNRATSEQQKPRHSPNHSILRERRNSIRTSTKLTLVG